MTKSTAVARVRDVAFDSDWQAAVAFLARYREPTRTNYEIALRQWYQWCAERDVRPLAVTRTHVEVYMRELEERRGLKIATVAGKINVLCGFYRLAKIDRRIVDNPCDHLMRPKVPNESSRQGLNRIEMQRLLDAAAELGLQEHALVCVLALLGPRVGEVCALDADSVGWQGSYRTLHLRREKGNRSGNVPLTPRLSRALDLHLGTRTTGALFTKRNGERLDRKAAARILDRCVQAAGITKHITPHSLRHSFITIALNGGANLRDLQNSMGYADARQLTRYDRDKDNLSTHSTWTVAAAVEGF